jgi:hypothetical protein
MEYDVDIFCEQFPIVKTFLYHLTCYRELHRVYQDLELKSEFWTHTIDAHLLQACILWCMVFGSHGCNPTHWKKLCEQDREKLEESFRKGLFEDTELTPEKWDEYGKDMRDFRGGYAAHRELSYSKPVPEFITAEMVAYYYDEWIRELIKPDIFKEPPLKESVISTQKRIRPLASLYLSETKLMRRGTEPQL